MVCWLGTECLVKPRAVPHVADPAHGRVKKGMKTALKTTSSRGRVNIRGAINLERFDCPFVEPATRDDTSAVQLLTGIEARNKSKRAIHVIRDNAACHRGPDVRAFLRPP